MKSNRIIRTLAAALAVASLAGWTGQEDHSSGAVTGGAGVASNGRFSLSYSIAAPVGAARSEGGQFALGSGLVSASGTVGGTAEVIFRSGFERRES
ncbi:MAG: hypothetical protein AAGE01_00665 [Pseudomonadota bacterium]